MIELLELLVVCACGFLLIMGGQFFWCWWVHDGEHLYQLCKALEGDPTFSGPEIKDD